LLSAVGAFAQGQVVGWGRDSGGQTTPRSVSLVPFRDIAGGAGHTLLLRADASVLAIGLNDAKQCSVPAGLGGVSAVAAGVGHSLALQASGRIVGWGSNHYGDARGTEAGGAPVLGTADGSPVRINGVTVTDAIQIAAGGTFIDDPNGEGDIRGTSFAIRTDGSVLAWGCGLVGQLNAPAGLGATRVAAGGDHAIAVRAGDGAVLAWGLNDAGQCGGTDAAGAPIVGGNGGVQVRSLGQPLAGVREVAAGVRHSLALRADGTVVAWGSDTDQENGTAAGQATPPVGLSGVTAIAASGSHSMALLGNGQVI
ncbi:MAG: RCC1 domain-containing protein, partial [Planctomycetota bacterium]